jgi:hypothetical protein
MMRELLVMFLFTATPVSAQTAFFDTDVSIRMTPAYPSPGETVTLTVPGADRPIVWEVNGAVVASGTPQLVVQAGELGSETEIDATVYGSDSLGHAQAFIRPAAASVVWSSDAYTPPFFRGKSLPGTGSTISLEALAAIADASGVVPAQRLVYTWKRNGAILQDLSGLGRSRIRIAAPALFASDDIVVDIATADDAYRARAMTRIASVDTHLALYRDTPLFGIFFNDATPARYTTSDADVTFFAAPYYAARTGADSGLSYDWSINGSAAHTDAQAPSRIELSSQLPVSAALSLALSSSWNYFENASASWSISLLH